MSDIQFLINLIMNHSLTEDAKKLCLERIGEIEERQAKQFVSPQPFVQHTPFTPPISQAQIRDMQSVPVQASIPKLPEITTGGSGSGLTSIRGPNKMRGRI